MGLYESLQDKLNNVRTYSTYFMCSCLWHGADHNPSLMVHEDGYHCKACGKHGSLAYLDKVLGSHFRMTQSQTVKSNVLPRWKKWEQEHGSIEGIANYAHKSLLKFPQFQSYFKKRKIDNFITLGHFGYIDGWILFPVFSQRMEVVDIIIRAGTSKNNVRYVLIRGDTYGTTHLYSPNWTRAIQSDTIYIVFGVIDSWSMESIGLPCVTGCTGKSLSADLLKPLGKKFIIVPDEGEERESHILANKLGWRASVKKLKYDDCKDPDEVRAKFGNEHLLQMIGA